MRANFRNVVLVCLAAASVLAQPLATLAENYRKTPNPKTRAAVLRFAGVHPNDRNGALALLLLGATEIDQRQFGDAVQHLKSAGKRLPKLADHVAYLSAVAQSELREYAAVEKTLEPVWQSSPASPWIAKAVEVEANAFLEDKQSGKAVALAKKYFADLPEPQAELLLARAYEADGKASEAAVQYQKVYVEHPLSKEASDAQDALAHYPALQAKVLLTRGLKLVEAGDYARARKELTALLPELSGADLDLARVRIGAAQYLGRDNKGAYAYLSSFQAAASDAEAERLYYLLESARRLDRIDEMTTALTKLTESYPQSGWRLKGLLSVANYDSAHNQKEAADDLFRACYENFPGDSQSAQCHWKVAWARYLRDAASASEILEDHLKRYPDSDHASTALYFLGRIAESKSDWSAARVYYDEINNWYPNYYYAILARDRLAQPNVAGATPSAAATKFLSAIQFPKRRKLENFVASATTKERVERANLLASAGLDDFAEAELRFSAKMDGQPHLMAVELADLATRRDAPDQGIRYIKHYAPGYLSMSLDTAPDKFWRLAFPLPYRKSLEDYSREHSLDPFLVAALIRQESEFNAKAVSRTSARGLTQVMPATGRELGRKLRIPHYQTSLLFNPDTNLKIGTYYLRALNDQLHGKWEATLASYNAGKSRVVGWMAASNYREPAEFVESIPFSETRAYVQSVLRNAEVYRRLYGPKVK
ncbi:MAG TPA: transglycosylase SLT domain-containing protein [Bryobacteraceae bacterium]|nr:transglycosylase SLT domain-containing protein [Bryobacteraceae bacterium]